MRMQKALNANERNRAFIKFFLFFLLTVVLIVTAIYFDFRMPLRENDYLQKELDLQRQVEFNQGNFVSTMQQAVTLLDSLDKQGTDAIQINAQLEQRLTELTGLQQKDYSTYGKLDKAIVERFWQLYHAKTGLLKLNDDENLISKLKSDLGECRNNLQQDEAALDGYRHGGNK
jgi:Type VI secretion system, TssO